jgi:hypothetical protein
MQLCDRSTLQNLCVYHSAADVDTGEANVSPVVCNVLGSLSTLVPSYILYRVIHRKANRPCSCWILYMY